jgi:CheY-like chemotaxis protein
MLIRHTVCRFLGELGFAVESATNGVDALERLASMRPDVIITDMQMPKMGGSEFIAELKARPETAFIPVVILTAKRSSPRNEDGVRADFVIYKDIDIVSQLQKALQTVLKPEPRPQAVT